MQESSLLDLINQKKCSLKSQITVVTSVDGHKHIEKITEDGGKEVIKLKESSFGFVVDEKPDLQVAEILPYILLSSQDVAQDSHLLVQHNVTHVLSIGTEISSTIHVPNVVYRKIHLLDIPESDFLGTLGECFEFIDEAREENKYNKILVHCNAGYSRSPSVVIAYLMKSCGKSLDEAIHMVKEKRNIRPNDGFMKQLKQFECQLKQ